MQEEIIRSNKIINVSYLKGEADYVVEYELKYNLSKKEAEQYKTSDNDFRTTYKIPAKELYKERKESISQDRIIQCLNCEHEYSRDESILFHNGTCPKCGF